MNESQIKALAGKGLFLNRSVGGRVEETHISWVILTKTYVFKIKKPLKLSFLDFSTLAKRKKYCNRELQLNRRFSPIYIDVLPVRKYSDRWIIGRGKGKVVDYVVRMKRLISAKRMDKLLKKKKVTTGSIVRLAGVVSSLHIRAPKISAPFQLREAKSAFNDIRSIISTTQQHLGIEYARIIGKSIEWSNAFLKMNAGRIRERIDHGFCRDVHGDLHSGNIFLYKTPILFDCIEFNDSYRRIDVINEIAFFCMDLEAYDQADLARLFVEEYQRYFACIQTKTDERLMNYYKCYRANVRAKVHAISAVQVLDDREAFAFHVHAWRTYLRLMKKYIK